MTSTRFLSIFLILALLSIVLPGAAVAAGGGGGHVGGGGGGHVGGGGGGHVGGGGGGHASFGGGGFSGGRSSFSGASAASFGGVRSSAGLSNAAHFAPSGLSGARPGTTGNYIHAGNANFAQGGNPNGSRNLSGQAANALHNNNVAHNNDWHNNNWHNNNWNNNNWNNNWHNYNWNNYHYHGYWGPGWGWGFGLGVSVSLGYPLGWGGYYADYLCPYGPYYESYYPGSVYMGSPYAYAYPDAGDYASVAPADQYAVNGAPGQYQGQYAVNSPPTANSPSPSSGDAEQAGNEALQYYSDGRGAFQQGSYRDAVRLAGHAAVEMPQNPKIHELTSLALFASGDYRGAATEAHAALALGAPSTWPDLYSYYNDNEKYTAQLRKLEKTVAATPDSAPAQFLLGYHYLMTGAKAEAKEHFAQAVKLTPNDKLAPHIVKQLEAGSAVTPPELPAPPQGTQPTPPLPAAPASQTPGQSL